VGVLDPLFNAVAWIIVQFHRLFSQVADPAGGMAWGFSIVCLVIVIRIALIPLFVKQIKSMRNMQIIQPRVKEIQQKHKNDRERQSQELMKLYRETGSNPFASCLPMLAQAPFFFALYTVLNRVAHQEGTGPLTDELARAASEATIFGAPIAATFTNAGDVANPTSVRIVTVIMILMMSLSQFITQRQMMVKNMAPDAMNNPFMQQQKMLMYVFPLIFAVFGINFPVGVLVYWLTTNFWTMGQQFYVIRNMPTPGSKAAEELEQRRARKSKTGKAGAKTGEGINDAKGGDEATDADSSADSSASARRQQPKRQPRSKRGGSQAKPAGPKPGAKSGAKPGAANQGRSTSGNGKPPAGNGKSAPSNPKKQ
jgi:YidC/Oxa1 family membrane protein insertase